MSTQKCRNIRMSFRSATSVKRGPETSAMTIDWRNKIVSVVVPIVLMVASTGSARSAGWELVFSDEFSGDKLDRTKWATRYIYNNEKMDHLNDEKQRYRD